MNLHGWDTVFVVDIEIINTSLATSMSSLVAKFDFVEQGYEIEGTFGAWSIVPGGSGKLLWLRVPIVSGSLTGGIVSKLDLSGIEVVLQVTLDLLPVANGVSGQKTLQFNFKSVGGGGHPTTGDGVVTPVVVNDPASKLTPIQKGAVGHAVAQCLVSNAGLVSYVFATVNPLAVETVPWLKPVASDYCYGVLTGNSNPVLAILSVNDARDISSLEPKVDPSIIAAGCNAGLAISPALVLKNILAPGLASSFKVSPEAFSLATSTSLTSQGFGLPSVLVGLINYYPNVDSFSAVLEDTQVAINLGGSCDMGMGISMTFNGSSRIGAAFDSMAGTFSFPGVGAPSFSHDVHVPWWEWVVGGLVAGLPDLIMGIVVSAIGSELGGKVGKTVNSASICNAVSGLVNWTGSSRFVPSAGGLAGGLYLNGDIASQKTSLTH